MKFVGERCDGSQACAASSQGYWALAAGVAQKKGGRHGARPKMLRGGCGVALLLLRRVFARVAREGRVRLWACGVGFSWGAAPSLVLRAPARARHRRVVAFCCCVSSFCFLSGGYALPLGVAPRFLIVYAPAMRAVAYYALSGVVVASASHGSGAWDCLTCWGCWRVHFVLL